MEVKTLFGFYFGSQTVGKLLGNSHEILAGSTMGGSVIEPAGINRTPSGTDE